MGLWLDATAVPKAFTTPSDSEAGPVRDQDILVGCLLAISGNLLISISLNLQKYTHVQAQKTQSGRHYLKQPIWWLGMVLMGLGEIGNFSAYGFAPASLVAPLGTTTVLANMFIAVMFLKEKLRPEDVFGCTLAIVGAFLLVYFSTKDEKVLNAELLDSYLLQPLFLVYVSLEIVGLAVLFVLKYKYKVNNVLVLLLICSLLASFTVISAKGASGMLQITIAGDMQLQYAVFWVMVVIMLATAITQVKFLNQAMKSFDATIVVPTNFVFFTISAICAGIIFYKEFWGLSPIAIFMFLFGCLLCFVGIYFITAGRAKAAQPLDPKASTSETVYPEILPAWLIASVNRAEVQPRADPHPHAADADRVPVLAKQDDTSSSEYDFDFPESELEPATNGALVTSYGSVDADLLTG